MKRYLIVLLLFISQAGATVEDTRLGPEPTWTEGPPVVGSVWPSEPCESEALILSVELVGPKFETDRYYVTPGNTAEYTVTVMNKGSYPLDVELKANPKSCRQGWFSWTEKTVAVSPGASESEVLLVTPDMSATPGAYIFQVEASAPNCKSRWASGRFDVQDYDYVSETSVSGTGQFQLDKNVRSMNSGIKSNKDVYFSGSVDSLVKNEYLVDEARGRNSNFQEKDTVDNYAAVRPGDTLMGTETVKSSLVFGGVGAKVQESYNLQEMEFKMQEFDIHHTGTLEKKVEFQTADNFTGYLAIDAKQVIPGKKNIREYEEFMGSFEIQRRMIFKDELKPELPTYPTCKLEPPSFKPKPSPCAGVDC